MHRFLAVVSFGALLFAVGCGGHSSGSSGSSGNTSTAGSNTIASAAPNVVALSVNPGPTGSYTNGLFASITVCAPGSTTNCQQVDNLLVDTGSSGVRILSSALPSSLVSALPQESNSSGNIGNCVKYVDGSFNWGPVQTADVHIANEVANSVPIQVIQSPNSSTFAPPPSGCTSGGGINEGTVSTLGANGVLGVSFFAQDCGAACTQSATLSSLTSPPYYSCASSGSCQLTPVALAQQLQNPVTMFTSTGDTNGVIIELPAIPSTGAASVSGGALVFGIGTQSNNGLGGATVLSVDPTTFGFTTTFGNAAYPSSFIDSGSNGLFFLDSSTTGIPTCTDFTSFYCPGSTQNLSAINQGNNGATSTVKFSVANADKLFSNTSFFAFNDLAGPNPGVFDWGLPFFFGRNVFTAIEGASTPAGSGPFWAY